MESTGEGWCRAIAAHDLAEAKKSTFSEETLAG
jgi:hypothetical protein